jgi:DNA mismatch endonuclease (patch repair protein)
MAKRRPKDVVSYNMSRIRSKGTKIEEKMKEILKSFPLEYVEHPKMFGKPDFAYPELKIAIFADSDFWHGFDWSKKKNEIKTNKEFWLNKIERNMNRDLEVSARLEEEGWRVIRIWGHDLVRNPDKCHNIVQKALSEAKQEKDRSKSFIR